MQTAYRDVFALKNSGLEAFLYGDVGAEPNGSALTVLSMIARLGRDPWEEAAGLATLTRVGAIERLAQSIDQMPLATSALADRRATAARLVQLLPATTPGTRQSGPAKAGAAAVPGWLPMTTLYCALAFGMTLSALLAPRPSQAVDTASAPALMAPGPAKVPSVRTEPVAGPAAPAAPHIR